MPDFSLDVAQTQATAETLNAAFTELQDRLNDVRSQVQTLLTEGFQTPTAQAALQERFDAFSTGFTQVTQSLQDMSQVLRSATETFESADQTIAGQISQIFTA